MKLGVFLPVSGRAAGPDVVSEAARHAEELGYDSVWAAERLVNPWSVDTPYPYGEESQWFVPPESPFLETFSVLSFLAGVTERISLGTSVIVLPYRHPLVTARVATSVDTLSRGRLILGVGIGWMPEEFEALGVRFEDRASVADEQLEILDLVWSQDRPHFEGRHYRFGEVAVSPRPFQRPRLPIWVGGESEGARMRAARYGDAWFSYFVRVVPEHLASHFEQVRAMAAELGRNPDAIGLCCCRPIEVTDRPVPQEEDRLRGTPDQLTEALLHHARAGVEHIALQFKGRWPERRAQIEVFGREALPDLQG